MVFDFNVMELNADSSFAIQSVDGTEGVSTACARGALGWGEAKAPAEVVTKLLG